MFFYTGNINIIGDPYCITHNLTTTNLLPMLGDALISQSKSPQATRNITRERKSPPFLPILIAHALLSHALQSRALPIQSCKNIGVNCIAGPNKGGRQTGGKDGPKGLGYGGVRTGGYGYAIVGHDDR